VEGVKCEKCGKRVVLKKTRKGKDFYGCEDYPNCTWASWHKPGEEERDCGGGVDKEKTLPKGRALTKTLVN